MGNVVCQHAFANIEEQARVAPIIYKGFMGDGMLGFSLRQQHWAAYDPQTRLDAHLQVHHDQGAILFKQVKLRELFSSDFERQVGDGPIDAYRTGLDYSDSALIADQRNVYGLRQRVPRMALCGVEVVRDHAFVRLPFCDKELVDFSLRVPPGLRYDRRLIKNTFIRRYPKLAQVPYTQTGLPLMECLRDVLIRAENVLRWHLNKAGLKRVAYPHKRPYQDYDHWMRTVLRPWVEATLLDDRALSRGHFKPEKVRQLVDEHMNGANHATRLGVLISIELWQRMFLD
jgi:hypothetical protein